MTNRTQELGWHDRKPRRVKLATLLFVELVVQWVNVSFFIIPNAYELARSCDIFSRIIRACGLSGLVDLVTPGVMITENRLPAVLCPNKKLLTWPLHAAYCAGVRWTCWNTIFCIFCIQAHNVCPFWKEGAHALPAARSILASLSCRCNIRAEVAWCCCADADTEPGPVRSRMLRPGLGMSATGLGKGGEPQDATTFGSTDAGSPEQHSRSRIWRSAARMQQRRSRLPSLHRGHYEGAVIDAPWSYHAPKLFVWCGAHGQPFAQQCPWCSS